MPRNKNRGSRVKGLDNGIMTLGILILIFLFFLIGVFFYSMEILPPELILKKWTILISLLVGMYFLLRIQSKDGDVLRFKRRNPIKGDHSDSRDTKHKRYIDRMHLIKRELKASIESAKRNYIRNSPETGMPNVKDIHTESNRTSASDDFVSEGNKNLAGPRKEPSIIQEYIAIQLTHPKGSNLQKRPLLSKVQQKKITTSPRKAIFETKDKATNEVLDKIREKSKIPHSGVITNTAEKKNFYVYIYIEKASQTPIYVGKGKAERKRSHIRNAKKGLNKPFYNRIEALGYENGIFIEVVQENLTEQEAFQLECSLIEKYGRLNLGNGPLFNVTAGGDGISGGIDIYGYKKSGIARKITDMVHHGRFIQEMPGELLKYIEENKLRVKWKESRIIPHIQEMGNVGAHYKGPPIFLRGWQFSLDRKMVDVNTLTLNTRGFLKVHPDLPMNKGFVAPAPQNHDFGY